ncbi:MAG: hypothetical protein ABJA71_00310 [Ginsengibacter sp.]
MKINDLLHSLSKKLLVIISGLIIVVAAIFYFWQSIKLAFVKNKLANVVFEQTDSLYTIKYDSLFFNELTGEAFLKNIRIIPDTSRIKNKPSAQIPYVLLDVTIKSIDVKGVKTDKALQGTEIVGDSIIIDEPKITAYFLKSIKKQTRIDAEAKETYRQILRKFNLIQVGKVAIKNAEVHAINFVNHYKQFDINNTSIYLSDVRIDSLHSEDTSRILFCKEASFQIDEFTAYNDNRSELSVKDIKFSGMQRKLSFLKLLLNRFEGDAPGGIKLIEANEFFISGINSFEVIKNKNIFIDSILCKHISFYRPPSVAATSKPIVKKRVLPADTTGFRRAYSLELKNIYFPAIDIIEITPPASENNFKSGNFVLKIRDIKADEIMQMQLNPIAHTKEIDLFCDNYSYNSSDNLYNYNLRNIHLNSLLKQISIQSFKVIPLFSEAVFAKKVRVQKDRYEINLADLSLNNINLDHILDKEIVAGNLIVNNSSIKIYRDLSYPLEPTNKIGHYPSQMIMKSDLPLNIKKVSFKNIYLEYKEKNAKTNKPGTVTFEQGEINIDNVTNIPAVIKENNVMTINYKANVLNTLLLNATFKFFLNSTNGKFSVSGTLGSCDAKDLNKISVPMAMIRIDTGFINGANFNLTGDDYGARGEFVMRYKDFKIALLKKGEENTGKKRRLLSALANTLIKNNNPQKGKLRSFTVEYDRDPAKSFFNLVWKSIFTGMKGTFGMPTEKIIEVNNK